MRLTAALLVLLAVSSQADEPRIRAFRVNLTSVGDNLYRESSTNLVIVTRDCRANLYMEDVIVNYVEPYAIENMIVLNKNGDYCAIKEIRDAVS